MTDYRLGNRSIAVARNVLATFLTTSLIALWLGAPASAEVKVFLLAGQSNMVGEGGYPDYMTPNQNPWTLPPYDDADAPCPAPYNHPLDTVNFWNYAPDTITNQSHSPGVGNGWVSLQNGYGNRDDEFGPELSFGAKLREMYPDDEIYLVKYAIGGTNLGNQWNSSNTATDALYPLFKTRVKAALDNLILQDKTPTIAGMIWMQGEDDTTNPTYAATYATNLNNFVTAVRTDFNAPDMKFVAGRITYMTSDAAWASKANVDRVRNAQGNVSTKVSNSGCVNTDDLQWAFYGHYGTQGQIDLGTRFANQFAPGGPPATLSIASNTAISVPSTDNGVPGSTSNPYNISAAGNLDWIVAGYSEKLGAAAIATNGGALLESSPSFYLGNGPDFAWTDGLGGANPSSNSGIIYSHNGLGVGTHIAVPAGSGTLAIWWCEIGTGGSASFSLSFEDGTLLTVDDTTGFQYTVINWQTDTAQTLTFSTSGNAGVWAMAVSQVPEPSSLVLLGFGLVGAIAYAWRKRN